MPVTLRLVDIGLAERADAILQHVARGRVDEAQRQPGVEILCRGHPVRAILGKKIGPAFEFVAVEAVDVVGIELLQLGATDELGEIHSFKSPSTADRPARTRALKLRSSGSVRSCGRGRPSPAP